MKALTVTQPWASRIAQGHKVSETRSWATRYRGPIAVHAGAGLTPEARAFARQMGVDLDALPLGVVIATARIKDCIKTEDARLILPRSELPWGFYDDGRWAWILENVRALPLPVPAKGALGLWEWAGEGVHHR